MRDHGIATRYAQALVDTTKSAGLMVEAAESYATVVQIMRDNPTLPSFLEGPQVATQERADGFDEIGEKRLAAQGQRAGITGAGTHDGHLIALDDIALFEGRRHPALQRGRRLEEKLAGRHERLLQQARVPGFGKCDDGLALGRQAAHQLRGGKRRYGSGREARYADEGSRHRPGETDRRAAHAVDQRASPRAGSAQVS